MSGCFVSVSNMYSSVNKVKEYTTGCPPLTSKVEQVYFESGVVVWRLVLCPSVTQNSHCRSLFPGRNGRGDQTDQYSFDGVIQRESWERCGVHVLIRSVPCSTSHNSLGQALRDSSKPCAQTNYVIENQASCSPLFKCQTSYAASIAHNELLLRQQAKSIYRTECRSK